MRRALHDARLRGCLSRSWQRHNIPSADARHFLRHARFNNTNSSSHSATFEGYYNDLLDAPLHSIQHATRTPPAPPPPDELPKTEEEEHLAKARVVFGSRLAGPAERQAAIESASTTIAGILVPPRPEEPENCCMSGCVNCVWDRYRDELEDWAEKSAEARKRLKAQRRKTGGDTNADMPGHVAATSGEDGGGSDTNWGGKGGMESFGADDADKDLFEGIPIGIREFMKTEKMLKAKHQRERERAAGG